ncbi:MAG: hypothetical protein LBC68_13760, partial [Prevotellaceae bacterium]|nr:hypothetical protein [Prevotellaceae bacterium]
MAKKTSNSKSLWLPVNMWNLNEVFTTESISPISFYAIRDFGNPVNRNQEKIEDVNHLVLLEKQVATEIIIEISRDLLDTKYLIESKSKYCEYAKTIYLQNGKFKVYFNSQEKLQEFLNNTFMLLELKAINKYNKTKTFIVNEEISRLKAKISYQSQILSQHNAYEPFFDKAFNQIKGLIYGYVIGLLGALGENEQGLVSDLTKLKNTIGGVHTDIALTEQYSNLWLINVRNQIKNCVKRYFDLFNKNSIVFDTLILRLEEIDNLNKMRCEELARQKSPEYKQKFERMQNELEQAKQEVYKYEGTNDISSLKKELEEIENSQRIKSKAEGKKKTVYKSGSYECERRKELKQQIKDFEKNDFEYKHLKNNVRVLEEKIRKFQFGYTQFDTSINDQFSRISEQLNDIVKWTNNFFLSKNNKEGELPDISFKIDLKTLAEYYFEKKNSYSDFSIELPETLSNEISQEEINLLKISLNAILSFPQGRLGNYSEENILKILIEIGKHLPDSSTKKMLREYYNYRTS